MKLPSRVRWTRSGNYRYNVDCICDKDAMDNFMDHTFNDGVSGKTGWTPLHFAARWGHLHVARVLIAEFKANINARTSHFLGDTPFSLAIDYGGEEVALAFVNEFSFRDAPRYIHKACARGLVKLVQALVQRHGVGILEHRTPLHDDTPLHTAAKHGRYEVVVMLINEYHCDTSMKGYRHETPLLHCACEGGNVSLVQTLILDHKANIKARDNDGNTPLHM